MSVWERKTWYTILFRVDISWEKKLILLVTKFELVTVLCCGHSAGNKKIFFGSVNVTIQILIWIVDVKFGAFLTINAPLFPALDIYIFWNRLKRIKIITFSCWSAHARTNTLIKISLYSVVSEATDVKCLRRSGVSR